MFQFLKRGSGRSKSSKIEMLDLEGQVLAVGDTVKALRYELGVCRIAKDEKGFIYESLEKDQQVSWVKMVDAITKCQKVIKIDQ